MENQTVETVKIKHPSDLGYALINKSDYNEEQHELFDAPVKQPAKKAGKTDEATPDVKLP